MFNAKFFKDNGYLVVPKILSGELLDFIGIHAYNRARIEGVEKNPDGTIKDTQVPNTPSFYGKPTRFSVTKNRISNRYEIITYIYVF